MLKNSSEVKAKGTSASVYLGATSRSARETQKGDFRFRLALVQPTLRERRSPVLFDLVEAGVDEPLDREHT